ncbi:MAG: hypothetical protein Q4D77_08065 [Peptostreptococcaceae bacterium]|nr:hypothetical protein [Peptostreptococcaceae bacterium]
MRKIVYAVVVRFNKNATETTQDKLTRNAEGHRGNQKKRGS